MLLYPQTYTSFNVHRILVLENGRIAEFDTPEHLKAQKGLFYRLMEESGLAWLMEHPIALPPSRVIDLIIEFFWFLSKMPDSTEACLSQNCSE